MASPVSSRPPLAALAMLTIVLSASVARAQPAIESPAGPALAADPVLAALIADALALRPELAQARALIVAERERVPQAGALPDPVLALAIQNDGFTGIEIGTMESSFVSIGLAQSFPWPGKRRLRRDVAGFGVRQAEVELTRARLTAQAEVERAYVDLLLVRDRLALLTTSEGIWLQAEGAARVRFESGDGAQADLLRAQLERNRLRQQRWALAADEGQRIAVLNRLRGHAVDEAIATTRSLLDVPDPDLPDRAAASADALARSPELARASLVATQAGRQVDLARAERKPDLGVSVAVMPRGGPFPPMWQVGVSVNLPVWRRQKQARAVAESSARASAARSGTEVVRQLLLQRVEERLAILAAVLDANRLYRSGLLTQSRATVASTLAGYQTGNQSFASVADALRGYVTDLGGYLDSVAAAQRLDIAERELSLDAPSGM